MICSARLRKKLSQKIKKKNPLRPQQSQFNMQQTMRWIEGDDGMSFLSDLLNQISIWSLCSGRHWNRR